MHVKTPSGVARENVDCARVARLVIATGLAAGLGLGLYLATASARSSRLPIASASPAPLNPNRFILNDYSYPPSTATQYRCAGLIHERHRAADRIPAFA